MLKILQKQKTVSEEDRTCFKDIFLKQFIDLLEKVALKLFAKKNLETEAVLTATKWKKWSTSFWPSNFRGFILPNNNKSLFGKPFFGFVFTDDRRYYASLTISINFLVFFYSFFLSSCSYIFSFFYMQVKKKTENQNILIQSKIFQ